MAGRGSKPVQLLKLEGKSHRTKKELEHREKAEKSLYTGTSFKESPAVKSDPIAHKEFLRLKKLYKKIQYVDGLDEQIINRYCMLISQEASLHELLNKEDLDVDKKMDIYKTINKTRDSLLKLEDRLFLNPTARVKAIPKTPEETKQSKMSSFLQKRGVGHGS
jgi:phage terminase small subunit